MKLVVPFSIPDIFEILFAAKSVLRSLMIGVPAHTEDSKYIETPASFEALNSFAPLS